MVDWQFCVSFLYMAKWHRYVCVCVCVCMVSLVAQGIIYSSILMLLFLKKCVCAKIYLLEYTYIWLPWWLSWQRNRLQSGRPELDPWAGKIPWRREWLPTPIFWPGEFHGLRSPVGYSLWGCKELDTTEWLTLYFSYFSFMAYYRVLKIVPLCYTGGPCWLSRNFPGKNTGMGSHSIFQGVFLTEGLNQGLLHCIQILYHLSHQGSPILHLVACIC